jgi:hypothetical protein
MKSNPLLRIIEILVLGGIAIAFISPLFTSEAESSLAPSKISDRATAIAPNLGNFYESLHFCLYQQPFVQGIENLILSRLISI